LKKNPKKKFLQINFIINNIILKNQCDKDIFTTTFS